MVLHGPFSYIVPIVFINRFNSLIFGIACVGMCLCGRYKLYSTRLTWNFMRSKASENADANHTRWDITCTFYRRGFLLFHHRCCFTSTFLPMKHTSYIPQSYIPPKLSIYIITDWTDSRGSQRDRWDYSQIPCFVWKSGWDVDILRGLAWG